MKTSRKLKRAHRDAIHLRELHKDTITWRFEAETFGFKDMLYEYSVKWEAFKGYQVINKNLFLLLSEGVDQYFMIGEVEIGEKPFSEVKYFLERKLTFLGD